LDIKKLILRGRHGMLKSHSTGAGTAAVRASGMRYRRPALVSLGWNTIRDELEEMAEVCEKVTYFTAGGDETLLNALNGDEEEEYEFRMAFSDLAGKLDRLSDALRDSNVRDYFDDCMVGLIGNRYRTVGYDTAEEDYFSLTGFEAELAYTECGKRLTARTKKEMLSIIGQCLGTATAFLDVRYGYDYLKTVFDILLDDNTALLRTVSEIAEAYDAAEAKDFACYAEETKKFDALVSRLPDMAWIS
jgi:hypothetical protein